MSSTMHYPKAATDPGGYKYFEVLVHFFCVRPNLISQSACYSHVYHYIIIVLCYQ